MFLSANFGLRAMSDCQKTLLEAMTDLNRKLTEENQKLRSNLNERHSADANRVDNVCICKDSLCIANKSGSTGNQCTNCAGWK